MRVPMTLAISATLLFTLSPLSGAEAQTDDPYALLQTSAQATASLQTARFSVTSETRFGGVSEQATPSQLPSNTVTTQGEFQAPDRVRVVTEAGQTGQPLETVTVGRMWTRIGASPWRSATQGPLGIAQQVMDVSRYLVNPSISDQGADYVVAADVDLARANAADPTGLSLFGAGFVGVPTGGSDQGTARVTFTIEKSTLYLKGLQVTTSAASAGNVGGFVLPGGVSTTSAIRLWDFNDPSISVQEPT